MIKKISKLLLICVCAISFCLATNAQELSVGRQLSEQRKTLLEKEALRGSGSSAREIALFHGTRDDKLFEYWSWIGAENGDPICQYNYASILRGKSDPYSKIRAIYWMEKAAARKVPHAGEALKEMTHSD